MTFDEFKKYIGKKIIVVFENGDVIVGKLSYTSTGLYVINNEYESYAILAPSLITSISEVQE